LVVCEHSFTEVNGSAVSLSSLLYSRGGNYSFQVHFIRHYRQRFGTVLNSYEITTILNI